MADRADLHVDLNVGVGDPVTGASIHVDLNIGVGAPVTGASIASDLNVGVGSGYHQGAFIGSDISVQGNPGFLQADINIPPRYTGGSGNFLVRPRRQP